MAGGGRAGLIGATLGGMDISPAALARLIDHTLLKPEATAADVDALVAEARSFGVWSVCVSPSMLPLSDLGDVKVATVCGFPSGKHTPETKAAEAAQSVRSGADEVDMVIDVGRLIAGDVQHTENEIRAVREAMGGSAHLKVIIESAALNDDQIVAACRAAESAGAHYVKTSTGFHPSGGASVHAVELMAKTVGDHLGVKASGGIRTWEDAVAMVNAGATRLGVSGTAAILAGAPQP